MPDLPPEVALEAVLQKRERAATRRILSLLTNAALDTICDHAFVVRRWHQFSLKMETYLKKLEGDEAKKLLAEFYRITTEIDETTDLLPPENPKPVVIRHMKWQLFEGCYIVPTGNTTQLAKLPRLNRGTLIFVPEDEDYDEERDEFSR